jgi:hypothetical protein
MQLLHSLINVNFDDNFIISESKIFSANYTLVILQHSTVHFCERGNKFIVHTVPAVTLVYFSCMCSV